MTLTAQETLAIVNHRHTYKSNSMKKCSYKKSISRGRTALAHLVNGGERSERDVGVLGKFERNTALDEVEEAGSLLVVAGNVLLAEDVEEGVVGGLGVLDGEAGEGVVGTTEEGAVGVSALDAVVELGGD